MGRLYGIARERYARHLEVEGKSGVIGFRLRVGEAVVYTYTRYIELAPFRIHDQSQRPVDDIVTPASLITPPLLFILLAHRTVIKGAIVVQKQMEDEFFDQTLYLSNHIFADVLTSSREGERDPLIVRGLMGEVG